MVAAGKTMLAKNLASQRKLSPGCYKLPVQGFTL